MLLLATPFAVGTRYNSYDFQQFLGAVGLRLFLWLVLAPTSRLPHSFTMIIRLPIPATPNSETSSTGGIRPHSGAYRNRTYTAFLPDGLANHSATITAMHHNDSIGNRTQIFR